MRNNVWNVFSMSVVVCYFDIFLFPLVRTAFETSLQSSRSRSWTPRRGSKWPPWSQTRSTRSGWRRTSPTGRRSPPTCSRSTPRWSTPAPCPPPGTRRPWSRSTATTAAWWPPPSWPPSPSWAWQSSYTSTSEGTLPTRWALFTRLLSKSNIFQATITKERPASNASTAYDNSAFKDFETSPASQVE